jgi:membrane protease subunit HflC
MLPKKIIPFIIGLVIFFSSIYTVDQREQVLISQFGRIVNLVDEPGLKLKIPFIQETLKFNKRILDFSIKERQVTDKDKKVIIIEAFAKYKITDPLKFYQSIGSNRSVIANSKLGPILNSSLRNVVGEVLIADLLSKKRSEIMNRIKSAVAKKTTIFGIEIVDVRIVKGDLPPANSMGIYNRMKSEREKEARNIRAEGDEEANIIRSDADKVSRTLIAEAKKEADIIRGQGEAKAVKITAAAFSKDKQFYLFHRSLEAYKKALNHKNTSIVISPENEFLRFFK